LPDSWSASLEKIDLQNLHRLESLPDSWPTSLKELTLSGIAEPGNGMVRSLPDAWSASLEKIDLQYLANVESLPDSWPNGLKHLELIGLPNLNSPGHFRLPDSLIKLVLRGVPNVKCITIPDKLEECRVGCSKVETIHISRGHALLDEIRKLIRYDCEFKLM